MEVPKLHIGEQRARALLAPLRADLDALAQRTARHATRLRMSPADQACLEAAVQAIQRAQAEVTRLWEAAGKGEG